MTIPLRLDKERRTINDPFDYRLAQFVQGAVRRRKPSLPTTGDEKEGEEYVGWTKHRLQEDGYYTVINDQTHRLCEASHTKAVNISSRWVLHARTSAGVFIHGKSCKRRSQENHPAHARQAAKAVN